MRVLNRLSIVALALVSAALFAARANADIEVHYEGFEDPGWTAGGDNWNEINGTINRVTSGTNGVTSADGAAHAVLSDPGNSAVFTRFGGYNSGFNGGYTASLDVYIDPTQFADGQGFDYSVATNDAAGNHRRDFIFHVGNDTGSLLVNASNNTDFAFNAFKLNNENAGDNYTIGSAGWYTFEHQFYDNGSGELAVDMSLYNSAGSLLYSITRTNPSDLIGTTVGGNRYGWFTYNTIGNLAIDNTSLTYVIPEPSSALACLAMFGTGLFIRRRKK